MAELSTQQDLLKILPKTICRTIRQISRFSEKILYCVTLIWVAVSIVAARARSHLSSSPPMAPFQSSHADCLAQHLICTAPICATQLTFTPAPFLVLESFTTFLCERSGNFEGITQVCKNHLNYCLCVEEDLIG